jgi:hypothetical protein
MSQDPPRRRDHLPPRWHADVEARKRDRLEFFLEHGEWIGEQVMYDEMMAGDHEDAIEVSRERALAHGRSPELVELLYGPSIHKKKDVGEKKE